jgi:hypothetical protein
MMLISRDLNTITMAWLTKKTSHMALAELLWSTMNGSLMANSKMELDMDIKELFFNLVSVFRKNFKMMKN